MIKRLDWDSEFFNMKVGELNLDEEIILTDCSNYDLIYMTSVDDFDLKLKGFKAFFSEQKVKFSKKLIKKRKESKNVSSYKGIKYNIDDLYELAFESGKHSRFLLDEKFHHEKFKQLYKLWIDNSMSGNFAEDVLLYNYEGKTAGMTTYRIVNKIAFVGLIAVSSHYQGKGIGGTILNHLETILFEKGINTLEIPTQESNYQACNFYTKQGYAISEKIFIKHYWKINDTI